MVKVLLNTTGIDVNKNIYMTSLFVAAESGNIEVVKLLVRANGFDMKKNEGDGLSPLRIAVLMNHTEIVEELINAGADINLLDEDGFTILHLASGMGFGSEVRLLVKAGADLNIKENTGKTALHWASSNAQAHVVKVLIEAGADLNIKENEIGLTPLHVACMIENNIDVIKLLVEAPGIDINKFVKDELLTPLDTAIKRGFPEVVKLLRKAGAKTTKEINDEIGSGKSIDPSLDLEKEEEQLLNKNS